MCANLCNMSTVPNSSADNRLQMKEELVFDRLFYAYHAALCFYAERILGDAAEAKDLVSEMFVQCWNSGKTFEGEEHARFFFYRSVRNAALNRLKANQRLDAKHQAASQIYEDIEQSHLECLIQTEVMRKIYLEIDALSIQERKVILYGLEGTYKLQEIADLMGLSLQTIKNCRSRAITKLKVKLSSDDLFLMMALLEIFK